MRSTLDHWLEHSKQQGGTIHGALAQFKKLTIREKDSFCTRLMKSIDDNTLYDVENAVLFFRARIN